jgi:hypothetical protein
MSRILRRPMFRGGPVDSRGTGITSGLADGGRVGYNKGNLVTPLYSASPEYKSGAEIKRDAPGIFGLKFDSPFLSMKTPANRVGGVKFDLGQSPSDFANALSEGSPYRDYLTSGEEFETEVTESGDVKFKLDSEGNRIPIESDKGSLADIIEKQRIGNITDSDTQGSLKEMGITVNEKEGTSEFTGDPRYSDQKIKQTDLPGVEEVGGVKEVGGDKEESVEYTVEDYIKMLGGDKARRRDLSDMLGRASASFLGTGGVREGLAEFMKSEAAAGPSRREKIEQAAATLDIKDKIASKRAGEQLQQTLAGIDYKIGATMAAQKASESLEGKDWIDSLRYVSENLFKGSDKGLDNTSVIEETLRLKYKKNVDKVTVSSETEIPNLNISEGFTIVVLPDGNKKIYEVVGNSARERTDLQV